MRRSSIVAIIALAFSLGASAIAPAAESDGFIHGTVETKKGQTFTGLLRWNDEEAFWGDHFNGDKDETPFLDEFRKNRGKDREYEVFGRKIKIDWGRTSGGRVFVSRFGDIDTIDIVGGDEAILKMKDGSKIHVDGGSNDVEATIRIRDTSLGDVEVGWDKIASIKFSQAPAEAKPIGFRLRGTVETDAGTFEGFIQWDKQECLSVDKLDGNSDDIRMSLEMGSIRSIARDGRKASKVELRDGRKLTISGTNDVNSENRGILVEDDRYGRVEIPWKIFTKATFDNNPSSGPKYSSYKPKGNLTGSVQTVDDREFSGRIVFDLDEERDWEMLDGSLDDVEYSIPFGMVKAVRPKSSEESEVELRNGNKLLLSDGQDVSDSNDGVLVLKGGTETYIAWDEVKAVVFD